MSVQRMRRAAVGITSLGLAALALAACGGHTTASGKVTAGSASSSSSGAGSSSSKPTGTVTVSTGGSSTFLDNFNPWSPNAEQPTEGFIYEPLFYFDTVKAGQIDPWLATSYAWSNGGKTITFQLRHGIKWSNGTPFTSTDVAFTLGLEMKNAALNSYSLPYKSIDTSGPYTVTINFTRPAYEDLIYLAGKTYIVDKALWKGVPNPSTYTNPRPIGTGAYVLSRVTSEAMTLVANRHYYMTGLPKVATMRFVAYTSNTSADPAIEAGQVDWASEYIPGINRAYVKTSSTHKLVNLPLGVAILEANDETGPTASLAVRRAISYAINRSFVSKTVYNGYAPPTNPEQLLLPNFSKDANPSLTKDTLAYDPAKAGAILEAAGYKKGANGMFSAPGGKPLQVTVQVPAGYTDYVSALQIIVSEEKAAGIDMVLQTESTSEFSANVGSGNFQLAMDNNGYTPSLYAFYYSLLDSALTAPIGKTATGDTGRFRSSRLDGLLSRVATLSSSTSRRPLYYKIEQIVASQLPDIPLFEQQNETEFNGAAVTGFPTASDPYAMPDSWGEPDAGWVAMHLRAVG